MDFFCSNISRYFFAFSESLSRGPILDLSSFSMSSSLMRFSTVPSSFLSASVFLALNFAIPAASSKMARLSSGLLLIISSTLP